MIVSFSLENWMSFRNQVTFSMVASRERQHGDRVPKLGKYQTRVLPVAAIYGGNASGKTNFFKALSFAKALVVKESGAIVDPDEEEVPSVRFVATRDQMHRMSEHALEVVSAGRPQCPLCGRPIDREGHFCPRTDGEAVPVIF